MRPEEIVELVGNIANRSDIREAQSKQVQAIYDLLAVRERETLERAAKLADEQGRSYFAQMEGQGEPDFGQLGFACEGMRVLAGIIRGQASQEGRK